MRLGYDRDVGDGHARAVRRRPLRPESRDWYGPADVVDYPVPHRTRIEEIQRPSRRTPRGYAKSSRSLDAYPPTMMPPPHLTRASTDAYKRFPQFSVYEAEDDDDDSDERWPSMKPRGRYSERARPRQPPLRKPREPTPESTPSETEEESESEEEEEEDDDDDDDDDDEDSNQIEVVVEEVEDDDDDDDEEEEDDRLRRPRPHHRRHRQVSREEYITSSDEKRTRRRQRVPSSSTSDEIEVTYQRQASSERGSPDRRPSLRREVSDMPRHSFPQRYTSVVGTTRPPVSSRRTTKVYESREIVRESRPRRTAPIQVVRESRSSSRRPSSLVGSMFGDSSRNVSPDRPANLRDCKGCLDEVPMSRCPKLECGHRMCHNCLRRRFRQSMTDPQQMPPSCCHPEPIGLEHVDTLFDAKFKKQWNEKFVEYSMGNRLYCPSRRCGEWIRPANIYVDRDTGREAARCDRCNTKVCVACNGRWHFSSKCPRDDETAKFLNYARKEGQRRCHKCGARAQLREGENHAACRCGANFCIVCGQKPKRCECPWFSADSPDSDPADMDDPALVRRGDIQVFREEAPAPPKERQVSRRARGSARTRARIYDEEALMRKQQGPQEDELARRSQYYSKEDEYEAMGGIPEDAAVRNPPPGHLLDKYRGTGRRVVGAPPSPNRPGFDRNPPPGDYYAGSDHMRGPRAPPMERRLADRFTEPRYGAMPAMEPPVGLMPPGLMPPPIGMPPPMREGMYGGGMGPDRVIVERDPNYDDNESYYSHSSRSRKSGRRSETPKSSELAGLSGRGTGMGRVDVWRKFVEPGAPEGELTTATASA